MTRIPASEIVRNAELALLKAAELRVEADKIEQEARNRALEVMGPIKGAVAYDMAVWSVQEVMSEIKGGSAATSTPSLSLHAPDIGTSEAALPSVHPVVEPEAKKLDVFVTAITSPVLPVEQVIEVRKPSIQILSPVMAPANELYGIDVPPSRLAEGDDIVAQAKSYASNGRKGNPFANDRGKNAWRKALFNAVWTSLAAIEIPRHEISSLDPVDSDPVSSAASVQDSVATSDQDNVDDTVSEDERVESVQPSSEVEVFNSEPEADLIILDEAPEADSDVNNVDNYEIPDDELEFSNSDQPEYDVDHEIIVSVQDIAVEPTISVDDIGDTFFSEPTAEENAPLVTTVASIDDPFDDLDALPPVSKLPPPRGYPDGADTGIEDPVPVALNNSHAAKPAMKAFGFASGGLSRPSAISTTPKVADIKVTASPKQEQSEETPEKVSKEKEVVGGKPIHTPLAIPANRRPGNGQALQTPATFPAEVAEKLGSPFVSKPQVAKKPPSFLLPRKG